MSGGESTFKKETKATNNFQEGLARSAPGIIDKDMALQQRSTAPNSNVQFLNKTQSDIQSSVFQDNSIPNISQPAQASIPELYIARQIELQQDKNESRLEDLKEEMEERKEEEKLASSVREPEEIAEKIEELQEDMEGVMVVVEKIRVVNETGRVVSERTVNRHKRAVADIDEIIDRAGKYGVDKEEIIAKLSKAVSRCKIPGIKEALREALEEASAPSATKESIAGGLGKVAGEEKERIAKMQKQSAQDGKRIAAKIHEILNEQSSYGNAVNQLLGILGKAQAEEFGKEELLREVIGIAGGRRQGIGKELQEIADEAKSDERKKEDVIADLREAAGKYLRKLSVIEEVQRTMPKAGEMEKDAILQRMQSLVSAWNRQEHSLEGIGAEMQKMVEDGMNEDEFHKKATGLLKGKKDIEREIDDMKAEEAVRHVRELLREMRSNEHIQEIRDSLSRPMGRDELVGEINSMIQGESEAVNLSKSISAILKKAEDAKMKTQDLIKELRGASKLAVDSELNMQVVMILNETEKRGMGKEYLVSRLMEIAQRTEREIEVVAGISALVSGSEKMTKKEIIDRLRNISTSCRRESDYFEKIFKNLVKVLNKKPEREEFFERMHEQLQGKEWIIRDIEKKNMNPGQATESIREIAEGLRSNPFVSRIDEVVKKEKVMQKSEIVKMLEELSNEIKQTKIIITELGNLVASAAEEESEIEREDIISAVENLAKTTSSDRLGRKLARMVSKARKEGMSKEDLIKEVMTILPAENNIITIFSKLRVALENDDTKEVNRMINILYQVNSEIVSVDVAVKKALMDTGNGREEDGKAKLNAKKEIAESARKAIQSISMLSHREEEREISMNVEKMLKRYLIEDDALKKGKVLDSIAEVCMNNKSRTKRIVAIKFGRFLKECTSDNIQNGILNGCTVRIAKSCLSDNDCNTKISGTKLLSRYFELLIENAWKLELKATTKHIDESVNAINMSALAGPDRLKLSALSALKKIAARNHYAAAAIHKMSKDRNERISEAAMDIIKELMI